jgi:hypothetical protein
LYANKEEGKLVLYAEMKLPGQAWLEFKIINNTLYQAATFMVLGPIILVFRFAFSRLFLTEWIN